MAMRVLHSYLFLILLATVLVIHSKPHIVSQVVYQKLEDALISDSSLLHLMQEIFIPSKMVPNNLVFLQVCVTVGSVLPGDCDNSSLLGGQRNFTYCRKFQWTSSALVNLISIDQLLILDNVISHNVFLTAQHRGYIDVTLHVDALPCKTTEDILAALMELLPWVGICIYLRVREMYICTRQYSTICIFCIVISPCIHIFVLTA